MNKIRSQNIFILFSIYLKFKIGTTIYIIMYTGGRSTQNGNRQREIQDSDSFWVGWLGE